MKKLKYIIILMIFILTACQGEKISLNIVAGEQTISANTEAITDSDEAVNFPAVVRSSGKKPVETEYKGIEVSKLLKDNNINISDYDKITFNAVDGYRVILNIEEILEPKNVYLTFERDGEKLKSKNKGGTGPFQLVIRRDAFSQRWVKHVNEIILE